MENSGKRLRQAREALPGRAGRPLSREALAARLGVSTSTLRRWEREGIPNAQLILALARELGVEVEWLLGDRRR